MTRSRGDLRYFSYKAEFLTTQQLPYFTDDVNDRPAYSLQRGFKRNLKAVSRLRTRA
jgi:hypothetical protein